MKDTAMLAVYGTLKRGYANHGLIAEARYIGDDELSQICLYDLGPYPGARLEASLGIGVEVYALSPQQLARVDLLEEYDPTDPAGSLYTRVCLATRFGLAWVYLYQGEITGMRRLERGAWHAQSPHSISQTSEE